MTTAANETTTTIAVRRDRRAVRRAAVAFRTGATCSEVSLFESSNSGPVDIAPNITAFLSSSFCQAASCECNHSPISVHVKYVDTYLTLSPRKSHLRRGAERLRNCR